MVALLMLAYIDYAVRKMCFEWCGQVKEGPEDVQDDPGTGQPRIQRADADLDRVLTLVHSD
jgi:hypothetical protein